MKKLGFLLASLVLLFVACDGTTNVTIAHEHTYSNEWTSNDTYHWHKATCSHKEETSGKEKHEWDEGSVTTEPTETTTGVKTFTCNVCEATKTEDIPATGSSSGGGGQEQTHEHTYDTKWTHDGTYHWHAATCEHADAVVKIEHTLEETETPASCTAVGNKSVKCEVCDYSKNEIIPKLDHDWGEGKEITPAGQETDGLEEFKCKNCEATKTKPIPATGHEHSYASDWTSDDTGHWHAATCSHADAIEKIEHTSTTTTKAATCTEDGEEKTVCTVCGHEISKTSIAALGHKWNSGTITTPAGCETTGVKTINCTNVGCDASYTETISATGHNWTETNRVDATEDVDGSITSTCSNCHETKKVTIPATGHEHSYASDWTSDETQHWHVASCKIEAHYGKENHIPVTTTKAATCTADGEENTVCSVCGHEISKTSIAALGHKWNSGTVTTPAGCETAGVKTFTCTNSGCTETKTETIPATGHKFADTWATDETHHWHAATCGHSDKKSEYGEHNWDAGVEKTAAGCGTKGIKEFKCQTCEKTKQEEIPALTHTIETDWTTDGTYHWHKASCGIEAHNEDKAAHGSETKTTKEPTCTEKGTKETSCPVCKKVTKTESIDALGHDLTGWKTDGDNHWHECTRCDEKFDNEAHGSAERIIKESTCTENGAKETYCPVCEKVIKTDEVDALGHSFTGWKTDDDNHWHICTRCGEKLDEAEHAWGDGVVTTEPTTEATGSKKYTCTCGKTKTETIPKLEGSDPVEVTVANKTQTLTAPNGDDNESYLVLFENIPVSVAVGDKIQFTVTVSGASDFKLMAYQSNVTDWGWDDDYMIWENDGIPNNKTVTKTMTATTAVTSINFQCLFNNKKEGTGSNVTFNITNIKVTNLGSNGGNSGNSAPDLPEITFDFANDDNYTVSTTGLPDWFETLRLGWNLGNSLDAHNNGVATETGWGNPAINQQLLTAVKNAGFDIVRIPVTWMGHIGDANSHYAIHTDYMDRVKEVVGYAHTAGLKVIINIHHDGGDSNYWLNILKACGITRTGSDGNYSWTNSNVNSDSAKAANKAIEEQLYYMWGQIAGAFPNSQDYIIFEVLNEIHDGGWAWGENKKNSNTAQYAILNEWNQICVRAIRYAGAKNYIGLQGYVCNPTETIDHLVIPTDKLNKLLVSVHDYDPGDYCLNAKKDTWKDNKDWLSTTFRNLRNKFVDKGIPVYIGETGSTYQGSDYNKKALRQEYNTFVIDEALSYKILPIFWDNGKEGTAYNGSRETFGLFNRNDGTVYSSCSELVPAMKAAAQNANYGSKH